MSKISIMIRVGVSVLFELQRILVETINDHTQGISISVCFLCHLQIKKKFNWRMVSQLRCHRGVISRSPVSIGARQHYSKICYAKVVRDNCQWLRIHQGDSNGRERKFPAMTFNEAKVRRQRTINLISSKGIPMAEYVCRVP